MPADTGPSERSRGGPAPLLADAGMTGETGTAGKARCLACHGPLAAEPTLRGRDLMYGVSGSYAICTCERCGSGTTLPLASAEDLGGYYRDDYTPHELPRGPLAAVMRAVQRARDSSFPLAALSAGRPRGRLLDVGCGRGDLAASWIARGWEVLGVEPSPQAAAIARRRGAEVRVGTLDSVALEPEAVDAAVFRHALEHVLDPQLDLRRVRAALRPGGRIAVIVPNWDSWQRRLFGSRWFPLELPRHRTHFTARGLSAALEGAGFSNVTVRPGRPLITTTWSLQLLLFGRCLTGSGWAGYLASLPIAALARPVDLVLHDGDFLHAAASRGA
jgi:SAM-dependent methyltransferase